MSLRVFVRDKGNGIYWVRGTVSFPGTVPGEAVYETTGTTDKKRAEAYASRRENEIWDRHVFGERATVSFTECALAYREHVDPSPKDFDRVEKLIDHFNVTRVSTIKQAECDQAVRSLLGKDAAAGTKAREVITPLTSILRFGAKRDWCNYPSFDRPRQPRGRTVFMTPDEAVRLIEAASPHLKPLLIFLFGTGARLYEALSLDWPDLRLSEGIAIFRDTKNGKDRVAKLSQACVAALSQFPTREGRVFLTDAGEPYRDTLKQESGQINSAWRGAMRRAGLATVEKEEPWTDKRGIARIKTTWKYPYSPHTCRHTWATWFYAVTRDTKLLQIEGDWSSLTLVERYSHLMGPDEAKKVHLVWGAKHFAVGDLIGAKSVTRRL